LTVPDPSAAAAKPLALFWRTEDVDPKVLFDTDPKAVERCKQIWRWNKARELARAAADKAAERIRAAGDNNQAKVDLAMNDARGELVQGSDPKLAIEFERHSPPSFRTAKLLLDRPFAGGMPTVAEFKPVDDSIVYESEKMR